MPTPTPTWAQSISLPDETSLVEATLDAGSSVRPRAPTFGSSLSDDAVEGPPSP